MCIIACIIIIIKEKPPCILRDVSCSIRMLHAIIIDDEQKAIESLSWELSNFASEIKVLAKFTSPDEKCYGNNSRALEFESLDTSQSHQLGHMHPH